MSNASDIRTASVTSQPASPKKSTSISFSSRTLITAILVVVAAGLGFWGGVIYGHHNDRSSTSATTTRFGGFRRGGGLGTVTAISSSSITVESRDGTSKTFNITSSTTVTDSRAASSVSNIADGDTVIVIPSSTSSSNAATIMLNPSFGGFGSPAGQASGSATSGSITTTPQ